MNHRTQIRRTEPWAWAASHDHGAPGRQLLIEYRQSRSCGRGVATTTMTIGAAAGIRIDRCHDVIRLAGGIAALCMIAPSRWRPSPLAIMNAYGCSR